MFRRMTRTAAGYNSFSWLIDQFPLLYILHCFKTGILHTADSSSGYIFLAVENHYH